MPFMTKLFLFDYATTPLLILLKNRIWVHVRMYIIVYLYGFLLTKGFGQIVAFDVFCLCFLPSLWLKLLICRSVVYPRTSWTSFGKRSSLETWSPDMMDGPPVMAIAICIWGKWWQIWQPTRFSSSVQMEILWIHMAGSPAVALRQLEIRAACLGVEMNRKRRIDWDRYGWYFPQPRQGFL